MSKIGLTKVGLKLWSINRDNYYESVKKLYKNNVFDFIELYTVPETTDTIDKWVELKEELDIPFNLHAPHFAHNLNLAKKEYEEYNFKIYDEVKLFSEKINPEHIIVHCGMNGDIEETIRQLKIINLDKMIVENKPYFAPIMARNRCRGSNVEEIKKVISELGCGFCLDVSHAICAANSYNLEPYEYLKQFNDLNPCYYHLCDGLIASDVDSHLNFGNGDYDLKKIFSIIGHGTGDCEKPIAIETKKASKENLDDFKKDVEFIRKFREV